MNPQTKHRALIVDAGSDGMNVYPFEEGKLFDAVNEAMFGGTGAESHKEEIEGYADALLEKGQYGLEDGHLYIGHLPYMPPPPAPEKGTISPWMPEQDRIRLAILLKLIEECCELSGRAARTLMQGIDEKDPASGRTNREELGREMSDVTACMTIVECTDTAARDAVRTFEKIEGFEKWHAMIHGATEAGKYVTRTDFAKAIQGLDSCASAAELFDHFQMHGYRIVKGGA